MTAKRSARNLLVDTRYQITYALPLVAVVAALFLGLGWVAARKTEAATRVGLNHIEMLGATAGQDPVALRSALLRNERNIKLGLVAGGAALCAALMLFGVLLTHRVAGPLYRLRHSLEQLRDGVIGAPPSPRKNDLLGDLFTRYRSACDALRAREQQELEALRRAIAALEQNPAVPADALEAARARVAIKERALG